MIHYYTDERHTQILIYLLKAHNIRKVVASPGTTNITFLASVQQDSYFEIFSCVDERSAAYLACGMAAESGESVVLSCTGATASRNYVPGLTEAFYRKLPILAITATQSLGNVGQNIAQVLDRSVQMKDLVKKSVHVQPIHSEDDVWRMEVCINEAILELTRHGGGPVHINFETTYSKNFETKQLPKARVINRIEYESKLPSINNGRIGVFVGAHIKWDVRLERAVDFFCEKYNAVVFCDQTSNYKGKYAIYPSIVCNQTLYFSPLKSMDILIHIGDISGSTIFMNPQSVWRVNPDGEVRDTFKKLNYVFEMNEVSFFEKYYELAIEKANCTEYYGEWKKECDRISSNIPELPFSNIWVAQKMRKKMPENSVLYLGILNSLRAWNYFSAPYKVTGYSNTGGFGIDGGMSSFIGASLISPDKLFFMVTGDLSFFYDMNVLGNRHIGNNLRLILVNNGRGTEFTNYNHMGAIFGSETDKYIAAAGHFGNKSSELVKHYAEDLGFEYLTADSKGNFKSILDKFVSPIENTKPILFEIFTDSEDESKAIEMMNTIETTSKGLAKQAVKNVFGEKGINAIKKILIDKR